MNGHILGGVSGKYKKVEVFTRAKKLRFKTFFDVDTIKQKKKKTMLMMLMVLMQ